MTSTQFMPYFDIFIQKRLSILSRLVWYYESSGVEAKTGSKRKLIDYRKNPPQVYNSEKVPGNVWEFSRVRYRMDEYENHPTQKPIALLERIIKASSNVGDTVLDPFSGTFTTSFVAQQLGRKSIGIELQEDYIKIGLRRLGLADEYNGEKLQKEIRTFETQKIRLQNAPTLNLFDEQLHGTHVYQ
jgi:site-specific DNA-methyltransferase (adenine-specific)